MKNMEGGSNVEYWVKGGVDGGGRVVVVRGKDY